MRKFLLKIGLFFTLVALIDVACGFAFNVLTKNAKYGETSKNYYIANVSEDDVIVLGSSHAIRHYVPSIIQDSLGLTCYNCGEPGCGIIPAYARYKMIAERHKPKLVIYEITPEYDYLVADDYSKYLGRVKQYANKKPVAEMYHTFGDDLDHLRLLSNMYRNNSCLIQNVMDIVVPTDDYRGYGPLYGILTEEAISMNSQTQVEKDVKGNTIDSLKLSFVERLFEEVQKDNVKLMCVISPVFSATPQELNDKYTPAIELCRKYGLPFVDNRYVNGISDNMGLFQDMGHLNDNSARKYTSSLVTAIKSYLD